MLDIKLRDLISSTLKNPSFFQPSQGEVVDAELIGERFQAIKKFVEENDR